MSDTMELMEEFREYQRKGSLQSSVRWYRNKVRELGLNRITGYEAIGRIGTFTDSFVPGRMYLYMYDPKTKDKLPYYDIFPLVFPFRVVEDGFYGLNLHYLPPVLRMKLLENLLKYATAKNLTAKSKIRMSWDLVGNFSRFPEAQPCVKRYLYSHIQSTTMQIDPRDWKSTLFLPLESFQKKSSQYVYRDSVRKMGS